MIHLDQQLLHQARRLLDAANTHRHRKLISAYEQAVALHNAGSPAHRTYDPHPERQLRSYVLQSRLQDLDSRLAAAQDNCNRLRNQSRRLQEKSHLLDIMLGTRRAA